MWELPAHAAPMTSMRTDSDSLEVLIQKAGTGDHRSFGTLYDRTNKHLFGIAMLLLRDRQLAEDVLQDTYVNVWKSAATYSNVVDGQRIMAMSWLISIVRNRALDILRLRNRRKEVELPDMDQDAGIQDNSHDSLSPNPSDLLENAALATSLSRGISMLEPKSRQCIALAFYRGMSHSEIAEHLGAPVGSVKSMVRRGLLKLKTALAVDGLTGHP